MTRLQEQNHIKYSTVCRWMSSILFGVAVCIFFGLAYPHHLHYQEQYQLFLFDSWYVWNIVKLPGGVADLLGRFCTQFFLFAWVGAAIIGVLLTLVQLLTLRLANWGHLYFLSYIPSMLLWLFLLDENALLGGVWAVLLTLLASWLFDMLQDTHSKGNPPSRGLRWSLYVLQVAAVPILYWIAGPLCLLFFLLQILLPMQSHRSCSAWCYSIFPLLAVMIIILALYIPVPARSLWLGIHYHRYPSFFPAPLWTAALSIFLLKVLVPIGSSIYPHSKHGGYPIGSNIPVSRGALGGILCTFVLVAVCMGGLICKNSNFKAERVMKYDFMARYQQWNRIIETINTDKPTNQICVTVQNLALGMHGALTSQLFQYNQNGMMGLLPTVERDATSPLATSEVFYQLGMINVAQRTVFEAQEAILDFQKSARCYKRLAQTNLINGNYQVARKYLMALQKTLFYRQWANETLPLLGNEKLIASHPEYGHLRKMIYKEDFYFTDQITPKMLEDLYISNPKNHLAYEYMMAAFMLTGDKERFLHYAPKNR